MDILNATSPGFEIGKDILNLTQYVTRTELKPVIGDLQNTIYFLFIAIVVVFIALAFLIKKIDDRMRRLRNEVKGTSDAEKIATLEKMDANFKSAQQKQHDEFLKTFGNVGKENCSGMPPKPPVIK